MTAPRKAVPVRFNPKADISSGRVRDVGGSGGGGGLGGGGRLPIPTGKAGGGIGAILLVVVIIVLTNVLGGGGGGTTNPGTDNAAGTDRYDQCLTGADANESADCARKAVEVSLSNYWSQMIPDQFRETTITTFSGSTNSGCGTAQSAMGPFYCPTDQGIYLDSTFFEDVLEGQLGGQGGAFVEPYVIGHEYGHHIQNLTGYMGKVRTQQGPNSDGVKLELQADCFAGMWTRAASGTTDDSGVAIFAEISERDIREALDAAKTVGDDRIQQQSGGRVNPEQWTHGSSAQRMKWFTVGYQTGSMRACDTFAVPSL